MVRRNEHTISIVIPVKNGSKTLDECLKSIYSQKNIILKEIIVLDSNSTDSSIKIALSYCAKIIHIDADSFNHGLSRNIGIDAATGDLVYFTVQDAVLSESFLLEKMANYFFDSLVMGVTGIQGVRKSHDTNPAIWFQRISESCLETIYYPQGTFSKLSKAQQLAVNCWDNVNSMYRKSALCEIPFKKTFYCEDKIWANDALHQSWKLLRDPSLLVFHYHHMYFSYMMSQKYIVDYFNYNNYRVLPEVPNFFGTFFRRGWVILKRKELNEKEKLYWISHNLSLLCAELLVTLFFLFLKMAGDNKGLKWGYIRLCAKVPQGSIK